MAIIYYSKGKNKIESTFLNLAQIDECTADALVLAIKETIRSFGLSMGKMIGLGTDNASHVMIGVNNGVYKKLKTDIPHLILVRCVCHLIQLAVSSATVGSFPRNLEYLISETYNWFSRSSMRQLKYKELY